ncbi:hypothetical protein CBO05C_0578 [Clostridium botulinum B str. Osaka05]|uniref:Uncharacterized protein n=1 Tax=Clostridium botulinum B str. Osaka05 TaxID=1407017 RepID=A0A0S6U280_CLOBO|nr:hypothetical protein [Clostridium botulinum]GAE00888.1 hypothetical protein CBO05C_0578 [Clostridium botulinum B str. Osaka05]
MKSKSGSKKSLSAVFFICLMLFIGYNSYKKYMSIDASHNETKETNMQDEDIVKEYGNLYGYVKEVNGETVSVDKLIVIKKGKGDTSKPAEKVEKFKITKDTDIILRDTYNSGKESKDSKGTINDIKTEGTVIVWGESKEDVIIAKKVVVFKHN